MSRAQAEIIGITLLIGFVLVSAGAVFVVGSSVLSPLEAQSEQEQQIDEMQSVAHEVDTMMRTGQADGEVGLEDDYAITDGATITFTVDGNEEDAETIETGQLEHEGLIYEGGLVVHQDNGQVISSPSFELSEQSSHINIPKLDSDADSFDGALTHGETTADIESPEEELEIAIESEYYEQWGDQFENADSVEHVDGETDTIRVIFDIASEPHSPDAGLSFGMDSESTFRIQDIPEGHMKSYDGTDFDTGNADLVTTSEDTSDSSGGGSDPFVINGAVISAGDLDDLEDNPGRNSQIEITNGVQSHQPVEPPTPTEELLIQPSDIETENIYENKLSGSLSGGVYLLEGDDITLEEIYVTEETIIIADGDLTIDETVVAEDALDLHVHGSLTFANEASVTTDGNTAEPTETHHPRSADISIFVADSDTDETIELGQDTIVTGLVHTTGAEINFDSTHTDNVRLQGAVIADSIEANQNNNEWMIYYDERLEDRQTPYATDLSDETISVPEPVVDVEDFDADETLEGPTRIEDDKEGNIKIDGDLDGIGQNETDGDLLVDGDITDELDQSTITGDLLVTGDVEEDLNKVDIHGDLRIGGELNAELNQPEIGGDLVIEGDVGDSEDDHGFNQVEIGNDLRILGDLNDELDGLEVEQDLIVHGDVTDEPDQADIGSHFVVGGDLKEDLNEMNIDGDVFVGGAVEKQIGEISTGGDFTTWNGIIGEANQPDIDGDLNVKGDISEELNQVTIGNTFNVTGDYSKDGDTDYEDKNTGGDVDTDAFPTFEDYLEDHTIEYEIPYSSAGQHNADHDFDIRITEIEAE